MGEGGYASVKAVKQRCLISDSIISADEAIQTYATEADNYINTQASLHAATPFVNPNPELNSLAEGLAAALYQYWNAPVKDTNMTAIKQYKKFIDDYIVATYKRANPSGLTAGTFSKTASAVTGTE